MIEIYLFINPMDEKSMLEVEKILAFSENDKKNFQFRFIPIVNLRAIRNIFIGQGIFKPKIDHLNHLLQMSYSVALDMKAAQLQGRKKGREFLSLLQKEMNTHNREYDSELVCEIIESIGANFELFLSDRKSELVKRSFKIDQQIAREMGVHDMPAAVVFNFESDDDGVLFEENLAENIFHFAENKNENTHPTLDFLHHRNFKSL